MEIDYDNTSSVSAKNDDTTSISTSSDPNESNNSLLNRPNNDLTLNASNDIDMMLSTETKLQNLEQQNLKLVKELDKSKVYEDNLYKTCQKLKQEIESLRQNQSHEACEKKLNELVQKISECDKSHGESKYNEVLKETMNFQALQNEYNKQSESMRDLQQSYERNYNDKNV
ncbi:1435_t:CDS:1, partial [Funneliformis geosporum]